MKRNRLREERGAVEVEATIILPIAILSVILLLYLALFMYQRANLQASIETCLVYYKGTLTDTFVTKKDNMNRVVVTSAGSNGNEEQKTLMAGGNNYVVSEVPNPYRGLFGNAKTVGNKDAFEAYFHSVAGKMLFDDDLEIEFVYENHLLTQQIKVSAVQTVSSPIDFSIIGVDNKYEIIAAAKMNVTDQDENIRVIDFAIDVIEDTKLGEIAKTFASKCGGLYQKMKDKLGVTE